MATKNGSWGWQAADGSGWRSVLVYTTAQTDTTVTINTTLQIQTVGIFGFGQEVIRGTLAIGDSTTTKTMPRQDYADNTTTTIITKSRTYNRDTRNYSVTVSGTVTDVDIPSDVSTVSQTITIPRFQYLVTYDVNGGDADSTPEAQTKWWGTNLTLRSDVPTRPGCTFLGWATYDDGTGTAYAPSQVYTGNHELSLYAVWLGASVPTMEVERTDDQGDEADEGTYGTVAASWQAVGSPAATVTVTALNVTSGASITLTGDTSGTKAAQQAASGNVSALFGADEEQAGALDTDTRYTIRVTVTVAASGVYSGQSVTATATAYVNLAYITIDAYAGGHGVAFGKTANREGFDVAMSPMYFSEPPTHDTDLTTAVAANVVTANSGVTTIDSAQARRWGKVVQLSINWTNDSAITVPASGNISNVTVGTIAEGLRPAILSAAHSYGDSAGAAWYYVATNGTVQLGAMEATGAERTIAAGTTFNMLCTYVLP